MFMLFIDAVLYYFAIRFAEFCELQAPCMLCSRFFKRKDGCFWSWLCDDHRVELSSSVSCSVHCRFADASGMCDECRAPIASKRSSNPESYMLLVGKSWVDIDKSAVQTLMMNKSINFCSSGQRTCTCCGKNRIFRTRSNAEKLLELESIGLGVSKANVKPPLPRAPGRSRFRRRDGLKRLRENFTGSVNQKDSHSHVEYTKLKVSSDTEPDFLYSEEEEDHSRDLCPKNFGKEAENITKTAEEKLPVANDDTHEVEVTAPPLILDQPNLLEPNEPKNEKCLSFNSSMEQILINLKWEEFTSQAASDRISLIGSSQQVEVGERSFGGSGDTCIPQVHAISILSEFISLCSTPKKNDSDIAASSHSATATSDSLHFNGVKHIENNGDTMGSQLINGSDSAMPGTSSNSMLDSTILDTGVSSKDTSVTHEKDEELKVAEALSSNQTASLKDDSTIESWDGLTLSPLDGESIMGRLKRQIEHDRNYMSSLYKELEEERNAAAIAANQAMAMITRLQEEKAGLHMEALQYLRMMEEQAENDMEALQRANDLLAEREKEMQDMEYELEFYRNNLPDEKEILNIGLAAQAENIPSTSGNPNTPDLSTSISPVSSLDAEKQSISKSLNKLERQIHQAYHDGELNIDNAIVDGNKTDRLEEAASFQKQIAEIRDQMEALESDINLLMHTCDLLQNGVEGLELVQEIAQHLQELRKMEIKER